MPLAIEQRDVFGFGARSRVGQGVEAARSHLREKIALARKQRPRIAAEIAEVDHEGLRRFLAKHFLRAFQAAGVHRDWLKRGCAEERLEIGGVQPDIDRLEACLERLAAAENPDL